MIQIGDKKVTKMIVGGNTMINRNDAWLECEVASDSIRTPVVMHYDYSNAQTTILGGVTNSLKDGYWSGDLITLPTGFRFVEGIKLPIVTDTGGRISPSLLISPSGRTISTTINQPNYTSFKLLFGSVDWGRNLETWTTVNIAMD